MRWSLEVSSAPASEPITTDDAKDHLRVDASADDTLIGNLITAARVWCENFQRRAYVTQTLKLYLDRFPRRDEIWLPRPPLQSVTSVVYTDTDSDDTTFTASNYHVDSKAQPGRIVLAYGQSWPSETLKTAQGVTITYIAGYGAAADVPQPVKQAMLLLIGHWYEHRESVDIGTGLPREVPMAVESLLWQDRIFPFNPGGEDQ